MAERSLPPALRDAVARLGSADIMVGIPSSRNAATIGHVVRAAQAGLVQYFPDLRPVVVNADAGSTDGTGRVVVDTEPPDYIERILLTRPRNRLGRVSLAYPAVDGVSGKGAALRAIFQMADALAVEALVVVDSDLRSIGPEWMELLAGPILKGGFDFVTPRYARFKWDGTITNLLAYPLTRSLYGLRIRQPIGGDFGLSGDLVRHLLAQDDWTPDVSGFGVDAWMTTSAIAGGFAVCETRLGAKIHDPKDPGDDLGPMFGEVAGTLLRLAVDHADHWLAILASHEVPVYGFERFADPPAVEIDVSRLLTEIVHGCAAAGATWAAILDEDALHAVERLVEDAEAGEIPDVSDGLWVRVVHRAVLAAGTGDVPIPQVVAALLPLYFARVAAFVEETRDLDAAAVEAIVERQARRFELEKPALAAAWTAALGPAGSATVAIGGTSRPAGTDRTARAAWLDRDPRSAGIPGR